MGPFITDFFNRFTFEDSFKYGFGNEIGDEAQARALAETRRQELEKQTGQPHLIGKIDRSEDSGYASGEIYIQVNTDCYVEVTPGKTKTRFFADNTLNPTSTSEAAQQCQASLERILKRDFTWGRMGSKYVVYESSSE